MYVTKVIPNCKSFKDIDNYSDNRSYLSCILAFDTNKRFLHHKLAQFLSSFNSFHLGICLKNYERILFL